MQSELLSFNSASGTLLVRYFTEDFPEGLVYNIDIPSNNGEYPTQQEIDSLVAHYKPTGQLQRIADVKAAQVPDFLSALVVPAEPNQAGTAAQVRGFRNGLLSSSDWTQLPDAQLNTQEKQLWAEYRQLLREVPQQSGFPTNVAWPLSPDAEPR